MCALEQYHRKRNFRETPEPRGRVRNSRAAIFVVQRHAARRLHFDFRLQVNGALASWAVPKGPPQEVGEKRLAIHVEDHPLDYAKFEGEIPAGHYGAGHVEIWDEGTYEVEGDESAAAQIEKGELKFTLEGGRLNGRFVLVKMRNSSRGNEWLLIRKSDTGISSAPKQAGVEDPTPSPATRRTRDKNELDPAGLEGALKSAMPKRVSVTLTQLAEKPFSDPAWLFEIKWDGERALAFVQDGDVELRARSGRNITPEYPELKEIAKQLHARQAILDGEIVVLDADGRSNFARIQPRFGVSNPPMSLQQKSPATYYAFDLLYCDGYDLRNVELEKRKELLRNLLRGSDKVRYSDHVIENGTELFQMAEQRHLEGIIAKRRDSYYSGSRSPLWQKFKTVRDLDAVIGGWTAPRRTREYFGALLLGLYDDKLRYIGNVGTGFDQEMLRRTYEMFQKIESRDCPFDKVPKVKEKVHWVKPELVARVKYGHWTQDKKLRQPVFMGFQEDRKAQDCRFEAEAAKRGSERPAATRVKSSKMSARVSASKSVPRDVDLEHELEHGREETVSATLDGKKVSLTHLNKIYFLTPELKKRDILLYYLRIAPHILPFLKDRPLVMKRYPNGINGKFFFQKEAPSPRPDWIRTTEVFSKERGTEMPYILANDRASLLFLTNLGCIDHNPWSTTFEDELHPDFVFFDLDPTEGTPFDAVLIVARAVHKELDRLGVSSYLKTSGASGFHIYVPLERRYTYEQARLFAGGIGQRVQVALPKLVTFERTVSKRRKGTVLIDAVQNARGKPLAAAYSLRPFTGAPVSTPVAISELEKKFRPEDLNIETIFSRLKKRGDLWKDFWSNRQVLDKAVARAL